MANDQRLYATFFVEDMIQYLLRKESILWEPPRTSFLRKVHWGLPTPLRFNEYFGKAVELASQKFKQLCANESYYIWCTVQNVPPHAKSNAFYYCILSLAERLNYQFVDNFLVFLAVVVQLCIRCCDAKQYSLISAATDAAQHCITVLAPEQVDGMFTALNCYAFCFLENWAKAKCFQQSHPNKESKE